MARKRKNRTPYQMEKDKLIDDMDKLFQQIIQHEQNNECQLCDKPSTCAHHWYYSKKAGGYATRWNLNNGVALCQGCHMRSHQSGGWFMDRLKDSWGADEIENKSYQINQAKLSVPTLKKWSVDDLQIIHIGLEKKAEEIQ